METHCYSASGTLYTASLVHCVSAVAAGRTPASLLRVWWDVRRLRCDFAPFSCGDRLSDITSLALSYRHCKSSHTISPISGPQNQNVRHNVRQVRISGEPNLLFTNKCLYILDLRKHDLVNPITGGLSGGR